MEKEMSVVGTVDLMYNGVKYPNIGVVEVTPIWEDGPGKPYFTTAEIEELKLPAEKIQLHPMKGMNTDFEEVIKPLFEGESVRLQMISEKTKRPYEAIFTFDAAGEAYGKKKRWYQGALEMSFPPRSAVLPPMQSVGFADVWFDNTVYTDTEIFEARPEGKRSYYTFELTDQSIPYGKIRLYLDTRLDTDFTSIIKPLLEGDSITADLVSKKGKDYRGIFTFDPQEIPSFVEDPAKAPFTGGMTMEFGN